MPEIVELFTDMLLHVIREVHVDMLNKKRRMMQRHCMHGIDLSY